MSTALSIPLPDLPEKAAMPDKVKRELELWMDVMQVVMAAERPMAEIEVQCRRLAGMRGFSRANMVRKYYEFKNSHNWRCLVNHAKLCRGGKVALPAEFIEFWKTLCERNQRKSRPAWRALIEIWQRGEPISGYAATPQAEIHGIPAGWSYRNLMKYAPAPYELAVARIGRSAAANYRPLVFTTRAGLEPAQFLFFDDLEHDVKVNFLGVNRKAMRPLELCCLDLFSGCKVAWGMKPTIEDDGIKQKLKEHEMRFLLAYVLTRIGYRPEGTTLCAEHGTAAIREDIEKILHDASDGAIRVQRSGIEGAAALVYEGRGKGNFRFKAALESSHNLAHNELAALPGQMGMDRDHSPEELHGREAHNNQLMKAIAFLPPERAALLRMPFWEFNTFMKFAGQVYEKINARDWHDLEGWVESGLIAHEYRLADDAPWMRAERMLAASDEERAAISVLIRRPGMSRIRKLSPAEVWENGRGRLMKLPGYLAPQILGQENGIERRIGRNGLIEFEDRNLGPGTFRYLARAFHPDKTEEPLPADETFLTFCNPFDPGVLHVCRAGTGRGAYIGYCRRWESVSRTDLDALHRAMGAAAAEETKRLLPFRARHQEEMRQRTADAKWNAGVLSGKPMTAEEKQFQREITDTRITSEDVEAATGKEETETGDVFSAEEIADVLKT
jgi:hypothetical protein